MRAPPSQTFYKNILKSLQQPNRPVVLAMRPEELARGFAWLDLGAFDWGRASSQLADNHPISASAE